MATSELHDNNRNIAELRDVNRPTILADNMSELYDNAWTNAYEEFDKVGMKEGDIIKCLLDVLMTIYNDCKKRSDSSLYFKDVQRCIEQSEPGGELCGVMDFQLRQQIKEFRKAQAPHVIPTIQKSILHSIHNVSKQPYTTNAVREYMEECVELCWFMVVQNPPVVLKSDMDPTFDSNTLRVYTQSGMYVAFVCWPVMYLHEGGPILCKGVAQGCNNIPEKASEQAHQGTSGEICGRIPPPATLPKPSLHLKWKTKYEQLQLELDRAKETILFLELENDGMKRSKNELNEKLSDAETNLKDVLASYVPIAEMLSWKEKYQSEYDERKLAIMSLKDVLASYVPNWKEKYQSEYDETENAMMRLIEMASSEISDDTLNVTVLSDVNRPTKLGEKMSELYDNAWIHAYDEFQNVGMEEDDIIKCLLDVLMTIYNECKKRSDSSSYFQNVQRSIEQSEPGGDLGDGMNPQLRQHIKEFRKARAPSVIPIIQECILRSVPNVSRPPYTTKHVREYMEECVELCWFMVVQDPPVVLKSEMGSIFDTKAFKEYTKRGKYVEFVCWPVTYLHEDGPMLCKGVAQGCNNIPEKRRSSQQAHQGTSGEVGGRNPPPATLPKPSLYLRWKTKYEYLQQEVDRVKERNSFLEQENDEMKSINMKGKCERIQTYTALSQSEKLSAAETKLSEMASSKHSENTPNVADLSDVKLAETYDNAWQNAYDVFEKVGI